MKKILRYKAGEDWRKMLAAERRRMRIKAIDMSILLNMDRANFYSFEYGKGPYKQTPLVFSPLGATYAKTLAYTHIEIEL